MSSLNENDTGKGAAMESTSAAEAVVETVTAAAAFHSGWRAAKRDGRRISALTAADYPTGRLLHDAEVDLILVGDSLGMVVLGYPDTTEVTMADMVHHIRAVRRGVPQDSRSLLAGDLPYHSYDTPAEAVRNGRKLVEAGAQAVKLEGGEAMLPQVVALLAAGIPVIGHIGMLPQSVREDGGYKKKGKTEAEAARLLQDALALDGVGITALVLEGMVAGVAEQITKAIATPTIGIGSGPHCDGQILVTHDLIGAFPWFRPPFANVHGNVAEVISHAVKSWMKEIP